MAIRSTAVPHFHRRPAARLPRPVLVSPKVAHLMGLGDYSVITPSGARISYSGTAPSAPPTPPVSNGPAPYPDGTLVAATGTAPVYVITGGQKSWIPNMTTLYAMGYAPQEINYISAAALAAIPTAAPQESISLQQSTASSTSTATTPAPTVAATASTTTPVYSATLEPGATYNASTGQYTNPDGTIYIPQASNYVSTTPQVNSVLEPGAVYNASTGYYTNPDGTIYMPASAASTDTIDLTSPSTWPTWVWLALAAGGTWLLFFKRGR
jgi:hypothetical protein